MGLEGSEQPCGYCHEGGEKERHFYYSWFVPHQDPSKASNQGGNEDHVWQRGQSQGKTRHDCCEGLPSGCIESSDLENGFSFVCFLRGRAVGIPLCGLRQALLGRLFATVH